ncbi:hypothetical protein CCACVL1_18345 [Corchorus capsularis]|uniref:Uncharacterized protein n=1 Tax=Corchorus capsularis TaxID=210143 RepID=A0A1R3HLC7_COCAP|nr:hypothetical protein CCACVL1_18345 [Corchorus capsularis]
MEIGNVLVELVPRWPVLGKNIRIVAIGY